MTIRHIMHRDRFAAILLGTTLAIAVPTSAAAQTTAPSDADAWQFELTP